MFPEAQKDTPKWLVLSSSQSYSVNQKIFPIWKTESSEFYIFFLSFQKLMQRISRLSE